MIRSTAVAVACAAAFCLASSAFAAEQLFVSGFLANRINVYAPVTGEFVRTWTTTQGPQAIVIGPDGDVYVAEENFDRVMRYDGFTGNLVGPFVFDDTATPADESGGLDGPTAIAFGPDGFLYVASFETDSVLRYDPATGAFDGVFVQPGNHGLNGPDTGTIFGPDGDLYVPSFWNHQVMRYDGTTGEFVEVFITAQSGGLQNPRTILFRGDGTVIVSSELNHRVLLYDAATGDSLGDFIPALTGGLFRPSGMAIGPDGELYVTSTSSDKVLRFDAETGAPLGDFVLARSGGLDGPTYCAWVPEFHVRLEAPSPGVAGEVNEIVVRGAKPGKLVIFGAGATAGALPLPGCPGVGLGVVDLKRAGRAVADASGVARFSRRVPARFAGRTVLLQAVDASTCRTSPVVQLPLE